MRIDKEDARFAVGLPLVRHPLGDTTPGVSRRAIAFKWRTNDWEVDPDAAYQDADRITGDRGDEQARVHWREGWWCNARSLGRVGRVGPWSGGAAWAG
jgi:hypothetical protein